MPIVPLRVRAAAANALTGAVVLPGAGDTSSFFHPDRPLPPGPIVVFPDRLPEAVLVKRAATATVLAVDRGANLFARRALVEPVLAPAIAAGEVVLREVLVARAPRTPKLGWAKGVLSADFVLVDVRARFPADRATLEASCFEDGARPYSSLLSWLPDDHEPGPGRGPRATLVRFGERPANIWAEAALFERLRRALGGAIERGEAGPRFDMLVEGGASKAKITAGAEVAEAAAEAFYRLYAAAKGRGGAKERAAACASPVWAYWLALLVDRAAADETRRAAARHPYYAAAYARDVERAGHAVTRAAAAKDWCAARDYALYVDRGVDKVLRRAVETSPGSVLVNADEEARRFDADEVQPWHALRPAAKVETSAASGEPVVLGAGKKGVVRGGLRMPDEALYHPWIARGRTPMVFVADEDGGKGRLRQHRARTGGLAQVTVLRDGEYGPLIVRRSVVAALVAGVPAADLALVPVGLHDHQGLLDDDFVLLDVLAHAPLDRAAAQLTLATPKAPHAGDVRLVRKLAWSAGRTPPFAMFAITELPHVVMVAPELAKALAKATGGGLTAQTGRLTAAQHAAISPPRTKVSAAAEKAAIGASDAFWRLLAAPATATKATGAALRAAALADPFVAVNVALAIDRRPAADTRKAARAGREAARAYQLLVERKR